MTTQGTAIALICILLACGCGVRSPAPSTLTDGLYTMESSIKETGVATNYGGSSQCWVEINQTTVRIEGLEGATNAWLEGTLTGGNIVLTVQHPDPMFAAMKLKHIYEGHVTANNSAEGTLRGFVGTNFYLTGTWRLTKSK